MSTIQISMLPVEQWQIARILRFRYTHIDRPCNATIVYFLPFEGCGDKHDKEIIEQCLYTALKAVFGDMHIIKRDLIFNTTKDEMMKIYDGGRPRINLTIRMTPDIPVEQYSKYSGKTIFAYDYHINVFLDYLGNIDSFNKDLLITSPFSLDDEKTIAWGADNIESL